MDNKTEEYLTVEEVASKLKLSKITVYRMLKKGELPAVKFGKVWRVSSKKLSELFNAKNE